MFTLSGLMFVVGCIVILVRAYFVGLALIVSTIVAVSLAIWAAMYSDPPSLLPVWAWLVGIVISLGVMAGWKASQR